MKGRFPRPTTGPRPAGIPAMQYPHLVSTDDDWRLIDRWLEPSVAAGIVFGGTVGWFAGHTLLAILEGIWCGGFAGVVLVLVVFLGRACYRAILADL